MLYIKTCKNMAKKEKEVVKEEKIYPSLILGLDISTSCIGVSIILDEQDKEPEIIKITHIVPKIPSKIKGIEALILRKDIFERDFLTTIKDMGITECIIESPITHTSANSNAQTVAQLLQFNGLLSESVYRVLGIVPHYVTSLDARQQSFPELLSIRKFNKKGVIYPISHIKKALKDNHPVVFGAYPFDCDKKRVMMNLVCEKYPDINWVYDTKGELKKENYDACDSLVCALAYVNQKRYGDLKYEITSWEVSPDEKEVKYTLRVWDKEYSKKICLV